MKPTDAQTKLIKQVQDTILKAEDASYKGRMQSAGETGAELEGIIYKYFGDEVQARYLMSPASLTTKLRLTERLKRIGYTMTIKTKADAVFAEMVICIYQQTIDDHTRMEETIEHLKIELEELTNTRPTDGNGFDYNKREQQMKEQGLVIATALFSVLKTGAVRGDKNIGATVSDTYKRRSQAAYKRTLYTADTYYQNTALCPGIKPKSAPAPDSGIRTNDEPLPRNDAEQTLKDEATARKQTAEYEHKTGRRYMYVTASDKFVCESCDALNGNVYAYEDAIVGLNFPPLHPNCRCAVIEVKAGETDG